MKGVLSLEKRNVGISILNSDVQLYNEHKELEKGFDPDPLFSKTVNILIYGRNWEFTIKSNQAFRLLEKNYQSIWILIGGLTIDALIVCLFVSMSTISTKLKKNTEDIKKELTETTCQLKLNEERLSLALQGTSDGIWDWDIEQDKVTCSERFKEMLGYRTLEFSHDSTIVFSNIYEVDQSDVKKMIKNHIKHRKIFKIDFRFRKKSGEMLWVRARGRAVWNAEGKATRMAGSIIDISKEKKAAKELKKTMENLKKKNKELEQFTYIASHDLRSPLINIMGFSEELSISCNEIIDILEKDTDLTEAQRVVLKRSLKEDIPESLHFINESVERMDMYSKSILELSRLGRRSIDKESIETEELVYNLFEGNMHQIRKDNIKIKVNPLPNVFTDKMALIQIFGNLIDNSLKYFSKDRSNSIIISGEIKGDIAIFRVADTGIGIPKTGVEKIFDVFQRGYHPEIKGNGMGLTFVKTLVERLGGSIICESIKDEGSIFTFTVKNALENYLNKA